MPTRAQRELELKAMLDSQRGEQHTHLKQLYYQALGGVPAAPAHWPVPDMIPTILEFEEHRGDFDEDSADGV